VKNKLIIIFFVFFLFGILGFTTCESYAKGDSANKGSVSIQQYIKPNPKAVYLVSKDGGQLSQKNIQQHPEVLVVNSFQNLAKVIKENKDIDIWIDKNATNLVESGWLLKEPQKYNLLVLIGYDNSLYSFREQLHLGIHGPRVDWNTTKVGNGFSVWFLTESTADSKRAKMKGYSDKITVENIIKSSSSLLQY
jgi:hypothetical protein